MAKDPQLTPGNGFFLKPNGDWGVGKIPQRAIDTATFSGYLTIHGYKSSVFDTPDLGQWAQKSTGTVAMNFQKMAGRIAAQKSGLVTLVVNFTDSSSVQAALKSVLSNSDVLKKAGISVTEIHTENLRDAEMDKEEF